MGIRWCVVILACDHTVEFVTSRAPMMDEVIHCRKCGAYQRVVLAPAKYSIRCITCRFSRATYGHVLSTAHRDLGRHLSKCPSHSVQLHDGLRLLGTITPESRGMQQLQDPSEKSLDAPSQ